MSAQAQELIGQVRALISQGDYSGAMALLRNAPKDRADWTPHEHDEVACLEEFLVNLNDPAFSSTPI